MKWKTELGINQLTVVRKNNFEKSIDSKIPFWTIISVYESD